MDDAAASREDYLSGEVEFLRNRYAEWVKETRVLERYALVTTGAIWSWGAVKFSNHEFAPIIWAPVIIMWAPVIITLMFGLSTLGVYRNMVAAREYLLKIEKSVKLDEDFGWWQYLKAHGDPLRDRTGTAFWWVLVPLTFGVAVTFSIIRFCSAA